LDLVKKPTNPINVRTLNAYVAQFEMMGTEGIVANSPEKDSILNMEPVCKITFKLKNNKTVVHNIYPYDDIMEETGKVTRTQKELLLQNRVFILDSKNDLHTAQKRVMMTFLEVQNRS
jgi:hypothetical protein